MRGRSSSSKSKNVEELQEPNLSGAYIRNLVKQLSSSRTKDSSKIKEHDNLQGDQDLICNSKLEKSNQSPQNQKKQVRRRLHTTRPYQERLINMAEARREIVTALKFHRAAMKRANDKQQQQQSESRPETHPFEPASSHHLIYPDNFSYSQGFCDPYSWPVQPITPPSSFVLENLNFTLPSQTLGLSLNLQDFNYSDSSSTLLYSSSSALDSSSPPSATTEEIPPVGLPPTSVTADLAEVGDSGLHHAMDDEEMAEIRSIGEQYQMEWNDNLNLVNSAWWFKVSKAMEVSHEDKRGEGFVNYSFDEVVEFPAWLNANGSCLQKVNDFCADSCFGAPALPSMDIEELDRMTGDWLA